MEPDNYVENPYRARWVGVVCPRLIGPLRIMQSSIMVPKSMCTHDSMGYSIQWTHCKYRMLL